MMNEDELSRLAEEALLREAQRGAQRAQLCGPSGWRRCPLPSTNKTFLHNTLLGALASNRAKEKQEKSKSEKGRKRRQEEEEREKEKEREKNTYKKIYLHASTKKRTKPGDELVKETETEIEKKGGKEREEREEKGMFVWTESGLEFGRKNCGLGKGKKGEKTKEKAERKMTERTKGSKRDEIHKHERTETVEKSRKIEERDGKSCLVLPRKIQFMPSADKEKR